MSTLIDFVHYWGVWTSKQAFFWCQIHLQILNYESNGFHLKPTYCIVKRGLRTAILWFAHCLLKRRVTTLLSLFTVIRAHFSRTWRNMLQLLETNICSFYTYFILSNYLTIFVHFEGHKSKVLSKLSCCNPPTFFNVWAE